MNMEKFKVKYDHRVEDLKTTKVSTKQEAIGRLA
jgi:hypothetical protein